MMKETPKYQEPFKITIDGQPAFFASNVTITRSAEEDTTKDLDCINVRDKAYIDELKPWPTSFSFETTLNVDSTTRNFRRMMGIYRPHRGSSCTWKQKAKRMKYHFTKIGLHKECKITLEDVKLHNALKLPF